MKRPSPRSLEVGDENPSVVLSTEKIIVFLQTETKITNHKIRIRKSSKVCFFPTMTALIFFQSSEYQILLKTFSSGAFALQVP